MAQRLSHNLPKLLCDRNRIVSASTGQAVCLRGVNLSGLEYSSPGDAGSLAKARITPELIAEIITGWNANVIRVPFNQDWALARDGYDPEPYRHALETVISAAAALGAYTIADLHWLDDQTRRGTVEGRPNFVPPLPNGDSVTLWRQLAERWSGESAILYDVFNEPHDPLPDDPEPPLRIREDDYTFPLRGRSVGPEHWRPWAYRLVSAIREKNPDSLIIVPGTDWGYDLRGCVLPGISNLVYSTHVYPAKGDRWQQAFGELAASVPVFAGEWGGSAEQIWWGTRLADYLERHGIGWTAWSWSDEPRLVAYPPEPPFTPTPFGQLVRELLRANQRAESTI